MTAREAIEEMRDMIGDRHGDYHEDSDVLRYLNRAAQFVANESESVRSGTYRPVTEGQGTYGMREDVLQIDFVGFKGQGESRFAPLAPLRNRSSETINRNFENGRPVYWSLWGRGSREKFVGDVETAPANGSITISLTDAPAQSSPRAIKAGDFIQNISDMEAQGNITSVEYRSNDVLIQHDSLVGGERATIAADEEIRITSPERSRQTLHISPPPDFTSEDGEENLFVYHAHKHRVITQDNIDDENDELEIDPQLEEAFLHRMCYVASMADKTMRAQADFYEGKYNYYYKRAMPRVRSKIREFRSLWFSGQAVERVRDVNLIGYSDVVGHTGNSYRIL